MSGVCGGGATWSLYYNARPPHGRSYQGRAAAPRLEHLHDHRLVRAPEVQEGAAGCCRAGQLGDRAGRVHGLRVALAGLRLSAPVPDLVRAGLSGGYRRVSMTALARALLRWY